PAGLGGYACERRLAASARSADGSRIALGDLQGLRLQAWAGIAIYTWDVVFRASTVVGFFGAGGMGHYLRESVQTVKSRQVSAIILTIVAIVIVAELLSAWVRKRIAQAAA
ncbi:MAG: hypothetical protein EBS16_10995, partial [Betaproteobacteria bacterium]|nr:hypothetical protein [Betaproteobacteria bacterium]